MFPCLSTLLLYLPSFPCSNDYCPYFAGSISLVELAIDQKATNYGLLTVYRQLALLMNAVILFNMKPIKPLSMFDSKVT